MADVIIRQNDIRPYLEVVLQDRNGAVDLTNETIRFVMRSMDNTVVADETSTGAQVVVIGATSGAVRYKWTGAETSTSGNYLGEFESWITGSSSEVTSYPNRGHIGIVVTPELST